MQLIKIIFGPAGSLLMDQVYHGDKLGGEPRRDFGKFELSDREPIDQRVSSECFFQGIQTQSLGHILSDEVRNQQLSMFGSIGFLCGFLDKKHSRRADFFSGELIGQTSESF